MRILVDSNILISAALNAKGTPYKAFLKAVTHPNKGLICDQNIEELRRIFNRKFPNKINVLEHFLSIALLAMEVVPTPKDEIEEEHKIRDVADRPIYIEISGYGTNFFGGTACSPRNFSIQIISCQVPCL